MIGLKRSYLCWAAYGLISCQGEGAPVEPQRIQATAFVETSAPSTTQATTQASKPKSDYACPLQGQAQVRKGDSCATGGGGYKASRSRANGAHVWHRALDLDQEVGAAVFAVHAGTVAVAGNQGAIGNVVILDHGDKDYSVYGHMSEILVKAGDQIEAGTRVGSVGFTGNSDCLKKNKLPAHLHFAMYQLKEAGHVFGKVAMPELSGSAFHPSERLGSLSCWKGEIDPTQKK